jgi:hypothetical protein
MICELIGVDREINARKEMEWKRKRKERVDTCQFDRRAQTSAYLNLGKPRNGVSRTLE